LAPTSADRTVVSVVVPTRGERGFLAAAVASALAQTVAAIEVLVVDDAPRGVGLLGLSDDPRVRVLASGGAGAAAARNRGLAEARAEAVGFLDDDDFWEPEKLARQLAALAANPDAELVSCGFRRRIEATGEVELAEVPARIELRQLLRSTHFGCSIPLVRRAALLTVGGFDERFEGSQDRDLWLRLRRRAAFAHVDAPLATVRVHAAQMSGELGRKIAAKRRLLAVHADDYRLHPREHAHQLTRLGMMRAAAGQRWRAIGCFLRAATFDRETALPRELLREALRAPRRQRRRLLEEGFRRHGEVVHFW
jgi:GT2 family glycosyltransferase